MTVSTTGPMRVAFVGCGYVADFYAATLPNHPSLELAGVYDIRPERAATHARHYGARRYGSLEALLGDESVELVVNLTNVRSHVEVTRAALEAGKHVYSEKPYATTLADAVELVELAERQGLLIASAPCNLLGESAQTLWHAIREGAIGTPRLVYAELDDGAIHRMPHRDWVSASGVPWPYEEEFEVGCVLEHTAYHLMLLTAMFGPVREVASLAGCLLPEKANVPSERLGQDFSAGCLRFGSGVVARLTCSVVAPRDHSLEVIGEEGVLELENCWDFSSRVLLRRALAPGAERLGPHHYLEDPVEYPLVRAADYRFRYDTTHDMDVSRGIAELAEALGERRPPRLSARHALHVLEVMLALAAEGASARRIESTFDPIEPTEWAKQAPSRAEAVAAWPGRR